MVYFVRIVRLTGFVFDYVQYSWSKPWWLSLHCCHIRQALFYFEEPTSSPMSRLHLYLDIWVQVWQVWGQTEHSSFQLVVSERKKKPGLASITRWHPRLSTAFIWQLPPRADVSPEIAWQRENWHNSQSSSITFLQSTVFIILIKALLQLNFISICENRESFKYDECSWTSHYTASSQRSRDLCGRFCASLSLTPSPLTVKTDEVNIVVFWLDAKQNKKKNSFHFCLAELINLVKITNGCRLHPAL